MSKTIDNSSLFLTRWGRGEHMAEMAIKNQQQYEQLKFILLGLVFFCVIGSYTVARELKDSIFTFVVGREYIPYAKLATMFFLVPAILLYARLVDSMRRYYLLCFYALVYAVLGLIFTFFLGHPTIGITNTHSGSDRIFGWLFYFFVEGFSPFVVSVFWAFANSVSSPGEAKRNYGVMTAWSKMGGCLTAGLAWLLLTIQISRGGTDLWNHQVLLGMSSLLLLCVPLLILVLMKKVPGILLHGYEAVYKEEKHRAKHEHQKPGVFAGLGMLVKYPYVLGIFGMVYFYEVIATVLNYMRLGVAMSESNNISVTSAYLFDTIFYTHLMGFFISLIGTRTLLMKFGERRCLMLIPIGSGLALTYFMLSSTTNNALKVAFIIIKSINYAFSWPVRESLYIPTVKEIKFKSKSWIDAFGSKFAKASGQAFNLGIVNVGAAAMLPVYGAFFASTVGLWFVTAFLLGRRYDKVITNQEVIGLEPEL